MSNRKTRSHRATAPAAAPSRKARGMTANGVKADAQDTPATATDPVESVSAAVSVALSPVTIDQPANTTAPEEAVALPPSESLPVSLTSLRVALIAAAKKDHRTALCSVLLHSVGQELRVIGCDGHRILVSSTTLDGRVPAWLEQGVMIARDRLDGIVAYLSKGEGEVAVIEYGVGHPALYIRDAGGDTVFKVRPLTGLQYPDYQLQVGRSGAALTGDHRPLETTALNPDYLKSAGQIASQLEAKAIFPFLPPAPVGKEDACPAMFTFLGAPGVVLYIMGIQDAGEALAPETVRLIGKSGTKLSVAALKAHATRAREGAKKAKNKAEREELEAKATRYTARIEELLAAFKPALPAPVKTAEVEVDSAQAA